MKINSRIIACSLVTLACVPTAQADTATLTLSGRILPGTCVLTAPATSLPDVKANDLVDRNNTLQNVTLSLGSCIGVTRATLGFDGTAESFDPELWKNTAATGAATGVSFALLDGTGGTTYIKKGSTLNVAVSGASASRVIRVGYYKTAGRGITAGAMSASIVITASYL